MLTLPILAHLSIFHPLEDKLVTVLQQITCKIRKLVNIHLIIILILALVPKVQIHSMNGLVTKFASIVIQLLYCLVDKSKQECNSEKKTYKDKGNCIPFDRKS